MSEEKETPTEENEVSEIPFTFTPVKEKPSRKYRKGSKYDPVIDSFNEGKEKLVTVAIEGKDANYIRTQLNKRIDARNLSKKMKVSVTNNVLYLEKI